MRDVLPEEAAERAALAAAVLGTFARYGYRRVITPAFEYAEVLERGLATVGRRDLLRFVEPESGEVALLRPDITPQIARIVATRLGDRPGPWRLAYQGTVLRRTRGRARRRRQLAQAGIECIGLPGRGADVEVIALAARACMATGLRGLRIELGHVRFAREALASVPEPARGPAMAALAAKDVHLLEACLDEARVPKRARGALLALPELYGEVDVLRAARRRFRAGPARAHLDELSAVVEGLEAEGLDATLGVDLGELRGQAYYTGVSFSLLAEGPGEAVGGGGRYDDLVGRYGPTLPATGFALDLDHLRWAQRAAGVAADQGPRPLRLAVAGAPELAAELRARGVCVTALPGDSPLAEAAAHARAWGDDGALAGGRLRRGDGALRRLPRGARDPAARATAVLRHADWLRGAP